MYEIAHRVLVLRTDPPRDVVVTLGLPYEEPAGEWSCPYRIDGLAGWEHERKVTAFDSLEAIGLAMVTVRAALAGSHEAKGGLLSWDDAPPGRRARTVYVSVDQEHDIAYVSMKHEMSPGEAVRQVEADDVIVDYGESGQILGLEILNAAAVLPPELRL
ncbi:DUF2283 domain-containing protein [Nonomuraea sp. B5E05]|uniref:DUF2283 domain-containing protein n=1 Tax=Nonomuraea sp. B5E05 TaxID=3153569 RepID=UPI0032615E9B